MYFTNAFLCLIDESCVFNVIYDRVFCLINESFVFYERVFICDSHIRLVIESSDSLISGLRWSIN